MTIQTGNPAGEPAAVDTDLESTDAGQAAETETEETEGEGQPEGQAETPEGDEAEGLEKLLDEEESSEFEVEHKGQKLKLPAAARELVMMQRDYTQKTQALAGEKQSFETERTRFTELAQATEKTIVQRGQLAAIDNELAEYKNVDWRKLAAEDQASYLQLDQQRKDLIAKRGELVEGIQKTERDHIQAQRTDFAKRMAETEQLNQKNITGWSREADARMVAGAAKFFGFTPEQLQPVAADHKLYRVLWDAVKLNELLEKRRTAKPTPLKPADTVTPKPATKVAGNGASGKTGLHDDLPIAEWMKRAQALDAKKRR